MKRFDRKAGKRIHFASAMTLLGKTDGASAEDGSSYLDIAAFIRSNGANPKADLMELWKRILFNMAISNTDDNRISLELAIKTAPKFGILQEKAKEYANEMIEIVGTNWIDLAKKYGLSRAQIEEMRPAFSFCVKGMSRNR